MKTMAMTMVKVAGGAATLAMLATGCSTYSDQSVVNSITKTVFDSRLPEAMEEVFAQCHDPLVIEPGMTSISLTNGCQLGDVSGVEAQTLLLALGAQGDMDLGAAIPEHVATFTDTIDGLPWPVQNCEIRITTEVEFDGLDLYDLDANWTTHDSKPSLHVDFDFNGTQRVGTADVDVDVDCPSGLSAWLINTFKGKMIDEAEGRHAIYASNMDLDLWIELSSTSSDLSGVTDVQFTVGDLYVNIDWAALGVNGASYEESSRALFEAEADAMLEDALADLGETTAELIEDAVPAGQVICSVSQSGGELTLKSDDPGARQCLVTYTMTPSKLFP